MNSGYSNGGTPGYGRDAAVNYKTRKRPDTTVVYTISGGSGGFDADPTREATGPYSCYPPDGGGVPSPLRGGGQLQRRRPRTWTCGGGVVAGTSGVASLTRSRTFTSNYERAISSLLWQPYECRSSSNSLNDDGDVAVWLNATGRYEPLSSRSSLSLSTIPRSVGDSCSSSVCRLLDDSGGRDKTPPCWYSSAETATAAVVSSDPVNEAAALARTTATGYRCPPRGSLLQRRSTTATTTTTTATAAAAAVTITTSIVAAASLSSVGGRPPSPQQRSCPAVQSNFVQRPSSVSVSSPAPRCVSAVRDWCCDNEDVVNDDDDEEFDDYYYDYEYEYEYGVDEQVRVDNERDDVNRVVRRVVVQMNNGGTSLLDAQVRGGGGVVPDAKPAMATAVVERTYASTEAQTDETACSSAYREQRRRERRERRQQQRRVHPPPPPPPSLPLPQQSAIPVDPDRLPDLLLNSHLPPPLYTMVGGSGGVVGGCDVSLQQAVRTANLQASLLPPVAFQHHPHLDPSAAAGMASAVPVVSAANLPGGFRIPFGIIPSRRRRSLHYCSEEDTPKSCCGLLTLPDATSTVSIRWFIGIVFIAGICSALVGTVLGATRASGREHLTVALLMIGVGVILVAISGIAWRLTAGQEASSCGAVFGLGRSLDDAAEANRRFVPRLPPSYGRPHHPYAAMMYPEFEYRAPPPSYQASMQEYRLRLLLLDRQTNMPPVTASPPPTYRSQPGTLLRSQNVCCREPELYLYQASGLQMNAADYSGPPSYRSRTGTLRPGCHLMDPAAAAAMVMGSAATTVSSHHSRNPSQLSVAVSDTVAGVAAVDKVPPSPPIVDDDHEDVCDIVVVDEKSSAAGLDRPSSQQHHQQPTTPAGVTIVQTTPATNAPGTVIVTVSSANNDATNVRCRETEMEILAHL